MASYFRSLFGGGSSNSNPAQSSSKSHSRSKSSSTSKIYAAPTSSSSRSGHQRSYSSQSSTPSPLRYATGTSTPDTRTVYGYGKAPSVSSHAPPPEPRPHVLRRASHKPRDPIPNYPIYTAASGSFTPCSSRSNSNSSIYTNMGGPPAVPHGTTRSTRSSRSDSGHHTHSNSRPPLTSNNSWQTASFGSVASSYHSGHGGSRSVNSHTASSVYGSSRASSLHMHPLLASSRLHRAPIVYDIAYTPSARTVLDRATRSAIPSHTLAQPATDPPTPASSRLILRSHKFPWPVIVTGASEPRFTIGPSKRSRSGSSSNAITNLDVLYAVHTTLLTPVTPDEWESLGHGSRAQQKVTKAYEKRCIRMGGGWEGGVRRIDWLGEKTTFVGVEVDKSASTGGTGKLVFSKP